MLYKGTLIDTDYGVYRVENIKVGFKVPTPEGMCTVIDFTRAKPFTRKYKIQTEIGSVIVDERQFFFQDSNRTTVLRLYKGCKIDTVYGPKEIISFIPFFDRYVGYCDIITNNYISSYYIHNGILLCS